LHPPEIAPAAFKTAPSRVERHLAVEMRQPVHRGAGIGQMDEPWIGRLRRGRVSEATSDRIDFDAENLISDLDETDQTHTHALKVSSNR
jgi:hypothetical protein